VARAASTFTGIFTGMGLILGFVLALSACGTSASKAPAIAPVPVTATPIAHVPASSSPAVTEGVLGTWKGTYTCAQGLTGMTLTIAQSQGQSQSEAQTSNGGINAVLDFYAVPSNPSVPSGSGTLQGTYTAGNLTLTWQAFTGTPPGGYVGIDLKGSLSGSGSGSAQTLSGSVTPLSGGNACTTFSLTRTANP
jgi:hypothetical protein